MYQSYFRPLFIRTARESEWKWKLDHRNGNRNQYLIDIACSIKVKLPGRFDDRFQ